MKTYYLLEIIEDVEPTIHGPYDSWEYRDDMALILRADDPGMENGLFPMELEIEFEPSTITPLPKLSIDSFGHSFFAEVIDYTVAGATP